ncbi:MAG: formylglycine-generating enzyme family protein [Azoarcus sp.]|jgi:formylglycine-generating enzyme required for sulfatase activity|nr:formylglycine-generating enzyme family protein [Azoarcus sp.]
MKPSKICAALFIGGLLAACATPPEAPVASFPVHKNSIGMELIEIPAGSFMMGSDAKEKSRADERPKHSVTISKPFYLGKYEVTQEQWRAVMGDNPSVFKAQGLPVENVSWEDIQVFIQRLNEREGTQGYRLPTEAEWEYAARAGTPHMFSFGRKKWVRKHACYFSTSGRSACPVGKRKPNPWGLYDMHGNVWEWVQDWYDPDYYASSPESDPPGPESGEMRILRGGSWHSALSPLRSAHRGTRRPVYRDARSGFRLAFSPQ